MNDINLLPDIILYRSKRAFSLTFRIFAGIVLACIIAALLMFKTYARIDLQYRIEALNNQINQSSLKELNTAQDRLTQKQAELEDVKKLYSDVPTRDILVNQLVGKIAGIMPSTVFAEDIEYNGQGQELTLNVTSGNREDMVVFLKRLYNEQSFTDINISTIKSSKQGYGTTVTIGVGKQASGDKK